MFPNKILKIMTDNQEEEKHDVQYEDENTTNAVSIKTNDSFFIQHTKAVSLTKSNFL